MENQSSAEARAILDEVAGIRASTRNELSSSAWQWLSIWSLVFVGAALTAWIPALETAADVYWLVAVPVAILVTIVIGVRADGSARVRRRAIPYIVVSLVMTVLAFGVSYLLEDVAASVLVWVVLGLGFGALCWIERQVAPAVLFAALGLLSAVLGLTVGDAHDLYPAISLAFGTAIAGVAAGLKVRARR